MTRKFWVLPTALLLSSILMMTGSVSHDAMAGIVVLSQSSGASIGEGEGPARMGPAADVETDSQRDVSSRYWMRGIVLLLLILLILWLIYRTFTGWKPMISCSVGFPPELQACACLQR
jgi:hypothetical protein